jgi:hypothetical protein
MFGLTSLRYAKSNRGKFNLMWRVGTNVLILQTQGEVSEWLKEHAWKVCIGQKPIAGSNPALSAKVIQKPGNSRVFYFRAANQTCLCEQCGNKKRSRE